MQKNDSVFPLIRRGIFDGVTFGFLLLSSWVAITRPEVDSIIVHGYKSMLAMFLALIAIGAGLSFLLSRFGIKTLGELIYAPSHKRVPGPPEHRTFWGWQLIVVVLACIGVGLVVTQANFLKLVFDPNQETDSFAPLKAAGRLFSQLLDPDMSVMGRAIMAMIETIFVAFIATAIAVPIAFVLSFLTARNLSGETWYGSLSCAVLRILFNLSRSIEPVLWAIIFSVWVGIGPFAGMLALMIHSIASLSKQYSEIVESVEDGPIEGIKATGGRGLQVIWYAIVPQVVLPYISFTIYRWDINVRMATILGLVGGGGIGKMLIEYQGQAQWHQVGTIIIVIAFVVWLMDAFSAHVRQAIK
jgi:phosphonate transport system permease protein